MRIPVDRDRQNLYAESAATLDEDHQVAGAEGLFDLAVTNALLAIVAAERPDRAAANQAGMLPSATALMKILESGREAEVTAMGGVVYSGVFIRTDELRAGILRSQIPRHGKGPGGVLTTADVAALVALDDHPALGCIGGQFSDIHWRQGRVADLNERARAWEYALLVGEEELTRRAEAAAEMLAPFHPKDDPAEPGECPVCAHKAIAPGGTDGMGYGNVPGTCLVCSYQYSLFAADQDDQRDEWNLRWRDL